MSRPPRPRYNFPNWNYGYTLGPPDPNGMGGYQLFYGNGGGYRPPHARGCRMPTRGGFRGGRGGENKPDADKPVKEGDEATTEPKAEEEVAGDATKSEEIPEEGEAKEGIEQDESGSAEAEAEAPERPLSVILHGRNPIMFCNDQSKFRGLHMEWEQVSETGPPHDKTFTWTLRMGEFSTLGSSNSKKGAKNKAAEEMAEKLDKLPKPNKRGFYQMNNFYPRMPPPWMQQQMMKRQRMMPPHMMHHMMMQGPRPEQPEGPQPEDGEITPAPTEKPELPKLINESQNNPISKMYEWCKKKKLPEPIFEVISENVLETRKTQKGFTLKKTEFTTQCSVQGKKFIGTAMTKKQAKHDAAAAAWAEIGVGVNQDSIDSLLQSQRSASSTSATASDTK